jgi:serine/threonine protein phosphatase 1
MIGALLQRLGLRPSQSPATGVRSRLRYDEAPAVIYAIGDIHGCIAPLRALEARILADAAGIPGEKWIVCLGDYVDRGPGSAMVLDHLTAPPPAGFRRICLAGNHEVIMFDFIQRGKLDNGWLSLGGRETLASYGLYDLSANKGSMARQIASHIPDQHIQFLEALPVLLEIPDYVFVHAGIDPGETLAAQNEHDLIWSRPGDFKWPAGGYGKRIVHGHTPVEAVDLSGDRINLDLGAYATGRLAALKIDATKGLSVIHSG